MALCPISNSSKEVEHVVGGASNPSATITKVAYRVLEALAVQSKREVGRSFVDAEDPSKALFEVIDAWPLDVERIGVLLAAGADPNIADKNGTTALSIATQRKCLEVVEMLLTAGADPNIANNNGTTALMIAAFNADLDSVNALLKNGANPNLKDSFRETALLNAIRKGSLEIVKALLASKADPNAVDGDGRPPMDYAVCQRQYGSFDIVKVLLENGADPNIEYGNRQSAFTSAIAREHLDMIEALLAAGAREVSFNQNKIDKDLFENSFFPSEDKKARIALARGADPNFKGKGGRTVLMEAVKGFNEWHVSRLLRQGADHTLADDEGGTALMFAAEKECPDVLRVLLGRGVNIDAVDNRGNTALMRAVKRMRVQAVKLLLAAWADPKIRNQQGHDALHIVTRDEPFSDSQQEIITLLQRAEDMTDEEKSERQAVELFATLEAVGWV